jgi:hypothetical protein
MLYPIVGYKCKELANMLLYRNNCGAFTPLQILAAMSHSIHNA